MDRSEISRALAKCLAYLSCGKSCDAEIWFRKLAGMLGYSHLLKN